MSVIIKATYVGCYDDPNLLAFWCIVKRDGYYYCFFPSDNNPVCNVTINGCLPPNFDCCNFVVSIEIRSSTLDQSEANLTSIAGWSQQDPYYSVGNSTLSTYLCSTYIKYFKIHVCLQLSIHTLPLIEHLAIDL